MPTNVCFPPIFRTLAFIAMGPVPLAEAAFDRKADAQKGGSPLHSVLGAELLKNAGAERGGCLADREIVCGGRADRAHFSLELAEPGALSSISSDLFETVAQDPSRKGRRKGSLYCGLEVEFRSCIVVGEMVGPVESESAF